MTLSYTPISEITSRIGCTDVRSAEKRCIEMGIKVHTMNKRKYVIEEDINREMELKYITSLQEKYPEQYKEIYNAIKENDYLQVYELVHSELGENSTTEQITNEYHPQGDSAMNFLKNLQQ
jgi:hypothetical protein